jgi:hypothetical protein
MQAQRTAPPDMNCKDKFLILSTVVPYGTTEDDITSDMVRKCFFFLSVLSRFKGVIGCKQEITLFIMFFLE